MTDPDEVEILLVEDNPDDAELTIRALKRHNLANRLHHVKDGVEALDFLFARNAYASRDVNARPKVVVLDLKLPKLGGLEVLEAMRSDARTRYIPVVVLTSSQEERDLVNSYRLGANSYVAKPVEFGAFAEAVSKLGLYWILVNRPLR
ncbi:MAG: two-component system response regulator [Armatimonadetes bacterium RBG_16_67_12]|nr:MAG: two-component system response regulator [Armatimonadetes bacterium RBG_16_67_12]